jgi:hypothetical protein
MELIYLEIVLMLIKFLITTAVGVLGIGIFYGLRIYFLIKKNRQP